MGFASLLPGEIAEAVSAQVREHPQRDALGRLCLAFLCHQAEARALSFGRRALKQRSKGALMRRAEADIDGRNVLSLLAEGPREGRDWAVLSALFVWGIEARLRESEVSTHSELLSGYLAAADWLEAATPYCPYAFVARLLEGPALARLCAVLTDGLLAQREGSSLPAYRAWAALRIEVLRGLESGPAREGLERLSASASDQVVRTLAREAGGRVAASGEPPRDLELWGVVGRVPRLSFGRVLSYLSGWVVVTSLLRLVAYAVGFERWARVRLTHGALHVHRETRLLGRTVRASDAVHALRDLDCVARLESVWALPVALGGLALAGGVVLSSRALIDALSRREQGLLRAAAILLGAGVVLDLLFSGWSRFARPRTGLEVRVAGRRVLAMSRVESALAARLVEQIAAQHG